ncbi:helicase-associated domain-containing protein, partial [Nocardiopsis coralliicola]
MGENGSGSSAPGTFTGWLRERDDGALAALFAVRPDLVAPVPADVAALAARAASRGSAARALDRMDTAAIAAAEAVLALGGADRDRIAAAVGGPAEAVGRALEALLSAALIWEDGAEPVLMPIDALGGLLPRPAGLGPSYADLAAALPPAHTARLGDPETAPVPPRLDGLGPDALAVLERLAWGPPDGTVSDALRDPRGDSPIDVLLARGLLAPTAADTVTLPREVGLVLRGGRLFRTPATVAPDPVPGDADVPDADRVARAAAGQAYAFLRRVADLLDLWEAEQPGVLRNGGLGVRDVRRAAARLDTGEAGVALAAETARAAGLVAPTEDVGGVWLPTPAADVWRAEEPARQWVRLAAAWLDSTRVAALAGSQDARGRSRNVLGEGLDRRSAPEVRRDLIGVLAAAGGAALSADAAAERLGWLRPRRQGPAYTVLTDAALADARDLGLIARGALAPYAAALPDDAGDRGESVLAAQMPKPLDEFLVQGDLTAVAPGPLVPHLAAELALAADVESTGGATVYRFGPASVRRALDAGRGPAELAGFLERHSATPLPQALRYLIDDVARTHARLRVGAASGYLRSEDTAILDELMSDRAAADLGLLRLAPTVVASRSTRPALLERLTELGYHPVPEAGDGTLRLTAPERPRAQERPVASAVAEPPPPDRGMRTAAVRALRSRRPSGLRKTTNA